MIGRCAVANIAFEKVVVARFTQDDWKTAEVAAKRTNDIYHTRQLEQHRYDYFNFSIKLADKINLESKTLFFCDKYNVNGLEFWDNHYNIIFLINLRKEAKSQESMNEMQHVSNAANGLLRNIWTVPNYATYLR